ncbi:MAG: hypothetical protein IJT23_09340, partial [Clostridia bacterium]|nr:hypothetical protein [Clostridia bacterium]
TVYCDKAKKDGEIDVTVVSDSTTPSWSTLATTLGSTDWKADTYGLNGGAPRLAWEADPPVYAITVDSVENGTVEAPAEAAEGAQVSLTVTPASGYSVEWVKVNGEEISAPYSFTMPGEAVTVTASFTGAYPITIEETVNGSVTASAAEAAPGTEVSLAVTPDRGYVVEYVLMDDEELAEPYSFIMPDYEVTIVAQFKAPWDGEGTEAEPYIIRTPDDLKALATATNGSGLVDENLHYDGIYFELENDIDMQGVEYTPIANVGSDNTLVNGTNERSFRGVFDGKGHVISNLTINTSGRGPALFGSLKGATIKDLGIENSTFRQQGNFRAATLAIYAYDSNISGCFAKDCTVNVKSLDSSNKPVNPQSAGGLVAQLYGTTSVSDCYTRGITLRTEASGVSYNASAGGFAGYVGSAVTITNCYTADIKFVTVSTSGNVANFARFYSTPVANVTNCYTDAKMPRDNEDGKPQVTIAGIDNTMRAPLSEAFKADFDGVNGGYPFLVWEVTQAPENKFIRTGTDRTDDAVSAVKFLTYDESEISGKVYVAAYDENGILSSVGVGEINTNSAGEQVIELSTPVSDNAHSFKIFVWDNDLKPLE